MGGGLGVIIFQASFIVSANPSVYFSTPCLHCIFQHFWFILFRVSSYSSAIYILPVVLLTTAWNITRYVTIMQILTLFDVGWGGGTKKAPLLVFRSPPNENKWEACICWSMVSHRQLLECCDSFFLLAPSGALIAIPTYYWPTHPPTFSDHTGPQHWTFTFWATTAI